MEARRLLPYIVGLLVLAFALASLSRGTSGGSGILLGSYWILYLAYLGPVAILAVTVALIIVIGLNWRDLGTGIGFGIAQRKRMRKKPTSKWSTVIAGIFWAIALGVLITRRGSIFNPIMPNATRTAILGSGSTPSNPLPIGLTQGLSSLVDTSWFSIAFLGLLAVGGLVLVQAVRVSLREASEPYSQELLRRHEEGLHAVHDALKLVNDQATDPRSRIISSYQHLIAAASRLGVPASPDLTARELDMAIRSAFILKGSATTDLTGLFEEARYSLHEMSEDDAAMAHDYLVSISQELKIQLDAEI